LSCSKDWMGWMGSMAAKVFLNGYKSNRQEYVCQ
jgi:hypothetical protein